jgi:hypothetical protein
MRMFAAILGLLLVPQSSSPLLSGRIVDSNGQGVPDVAVLSQLFNPTGGYSTVKTHTNQDGRFSFAADGKVIFVRKAGFVPLTHMLTQDEKQVQIVLEPVSELKTLNVPSCQDMYGVDRQILSSHKFKPKGVTLYGEAHLYPVPDNAAVEHKSDIDYGAEIVSYRKGRKNHMLIYRGYSYLGEYPDVHLFDNVNEFTERALSTAENTEEIKGTLKNGHRFRWIGASFGTAFYHDVTSEAAEYFDRIIDKGCILD